MNSDPSECDCPSCRTPTVRGDVCTTCGEPWADDAPEGFADGALGFPSPGAHSVAYWAHFDRSRALAADARVARIRAVVEYEEETPW